MFTIHYLICTAAVHLLVGQWYNSTMMHDGNNMVLCYTVYTMVLNNYHIIRNVHVFQDISMITVALPCYCTSPKKYDPMVLCCYLRSGFKCPYLRSKTVNL